jgi:hypothetical protein
LGVQNKETAILDLGDARSIALIEENRARIAMLGDYALDRPRRLPPHTQREPKLNREGAKGAMTRSRPKPIIAGFIVFLKH